MGAFIVSGLIIAGTLALCAVLVFAESMSDAPSMDNQYPVLGIFVGGVALAGLVFASHWFHIGL